MVFIMCRNPDGTDEGTPSGSSNDASSSGVLIVSEDGIKFIVCHCLVQKGIILTFWFKWDVG